MWRGKPMVPGGRPLIDIGYKYNARKVLSFIVTDKAGSTKSGIPYLSKYPDQFNNVSIRPVSLTLVMSKINLLLMRLISTKNQGNMILHWISSGLLSMVGCGYL